MAGVITRRKLIAGVAAGGSSIALSAWTGPTYDPFFQDNVLSIGQWLNYRVQRLVMGNALAQEFRESDMSPVFRTNGNTDPGTPEYQKLAADQFADWRLRIDGLVDSPTSYSLAELRAMPSRTQITRHDCVEGWSAIGKWTGVQLGRLLKQVGLQPSARFILFHCADNFDGTHGRDPNARRVDYIGFDRLGAQPAARSARGIGGERRTHAAERARR
jgi:DMSO/TMAO reductase YedYZ molybdopterin-dependent catalytic subunit